MKHTAAALRAWIKVRKELEAANVMAQDAKKRARELGGDLEHHRCEVQRAALQENVLAGGIVLAITIEDVTLALTHGEQGIQIEDAKQVFFDD